MSTIKIFFVGATGFIGGSILSSLISHRLSKLFSITVLVRSPANVEKFKALGMRAVVGSNADLDLLTKEAADADIIFSCADCDNVEAITAILAGTKKRFEHSGIAASLIHTSGTGVLSDDTEGMRATETVYSDLDLPLLDSLAPTQPHRPVDLTIFDADAQGYVKTYVVAPGSIYGRAKGPLVELKMQRALSIHIPELARIALARNQAGVLGTGANRWVNIHISDLVDLFIILFDTILATSLTSVKPPAEFQHGRAGFYFANSDEHDMYQISKRIGEVLHALDIGSEEPTSFTKEELAAYPLLEVTCVGANSRSSSDRMKALGWQPKHFTADEISSIEEEVMTALRARQ